MVIKYLESSYVGDPQNETMVTGLCQVCVVSVVRTVSMVVAPNISVSRKYCGMLITSVCLSERISCCVFVEVSVLGLE